MTDEILENSAPEAKEAGACEKNGQKCGSKKEKGAKCHEQLEAALSKIAELEAAISEKDDRHLRMAAEYENFRRRSKEEKDATYENALADTVAAILPIIDNLERAAAFGEDSPLKDGLVMILNSVSEVFSRLGVEAVGKAGEQFDPRYHNAVMHEEDADMGENEITEVFQKGYKKGNKIIRFAMVKTVN